MSNYHSAYSLVEDRYLDDYANRNDGRKLVRDLIEDLVRRRMKDLDDRDDLTQRVPKWASAHPIALLEQEFGIEIRQHDEPIEPGTTSSS